jgi:F-type H+-transporting ATPase subunit epsilon
MAATYPLQIVSQEEMTYQGEVESLVAPAALGYLGVLANHAPLLTSLTEGLLTIREAQGDNKIFKVRGGILEVSAKEVVILADYIEDATPS